MIKVKKKERNFPEMTSLYQLVDLMSEKENKCAFKYFGRNRELLEKKSF